MPGPGGTPYRGGGSSVTIDMPNLGSFLGTIRGASAGLVSQVDRITEHVAKDVRDAAKDLVAKDTHLTEQNIRVEHRERGAVYTVVSDRGGERDTVPIWLEIGTYKMAARPFMKPAADMALAAGGLMRVTHSMGGLLPPMSGQGRGR